MSWGGEQDRYLRVYVSFLLADRCLVRAPETKTSVLVVTDSARSAAERPDAVPASRRDAPSSNFVRDIVDEDVRKGTYGGKVVTRFPPEPNGYPHIGHIKSIVLNFGLAADFGGACNLRYDDTNPETESMEYVEAIRQGVRWLGYSWEGREFFASDYFEQLYSFAERLIEDGNAYVDSGSEEEIRAGRGTVTVPGTASPYRSRSIEENLDLFRRMRAGEFPDGAHVLRARGDMASPNMKMRDPLLYRIRHANHYRRGETWCIYPMYDFAHPLSDAIEGITHSLCTLEFDNNREIYDWVLDRLVAEPRPHQYEFARLALDYTVLSKRKLLQLVRENHVSGWDDPRMPTLAGIQRRGYTPEALRDFCERIGVAKVNSRVDLALLEYSLRNDLNFRAPRVMCVLRPLKVVVTNFPEGETDWIDASYWPHDVPKEGSRRVPFTRELFIERDDFMETPTAKYHRLAPGREVRLRYGYFVRCTDVVKDATGEVVEVHCTYDPATRGGDAPDGRKVQGTIHWVSAAHALEAEVRLYDRLFSEPDPEAGDRSFLETLNPDSLEILKGARIEPSVAEDAVDTRYQFERLGYFWRDPVDASPGALVFNRIVSLRDSWAKVAAPDRPSAAERPSTPSDEVNGARTEASAPVAAASDPMERLGEAEREAVVRYTKELNLQLDDALILAADAGLATFFEEAVASYNSPQTVANWLINELRRELKDREPVDLPFTAQAFARLVRMVDGNALTGGLARDVLAELVQRGGDPEAIIEEKGLRPVNDPETLAPMVEAVLQAMPDKVAQYRAGKTGLMGLFVGQVMKKTGGKADPSLVNKMLAERLA